MFLEQGPSELCGADPGSSDQRRKKTHCNFEEHMDTHCSAVTGSVDDQADGALATVSRFPML